jgi:hypothetical protein
VAIKPRAIALACFPICNAPLSNGAFVAAHQSRDGMEGSMKMMSWSRYHCLPWSLMHAARRHRVAKIHRTRRIMLSLVVTPRRVRRQVSSGRPSVSNS